MTTNSTPEERRKKLKNDQLGKIFQVIGSPTEDDDLTSFLNPKQIADVQFFPKQAGINLHDLYPGTESAGIELLKKMLKFNPNKRITAEEAIKDSYFDDIRLPEQETSADLEPINLEFDQSDSEALSLEALKELIIKEISQVGHTQFDFENDFAEELCEDY